MSREAMKHIKTWSERCEEHPDHQTGMITERMIQERMQEEIDELRQALVDADDTSEKRVDETAKQEHEPVAWANSPADGPVAWSCQCGRPYTVTCISSKPQKKEWVGLTLNEAEDFYEKYTDRAELINAIDKFLEEKNHG